MSALRVEEYSHASREAWDTFVRQSKNATFLFERAFMEYHAQRFVDASLLVYDESDRVIALLPANRKGSVVQSHAGLGLGGLLTDKRMSIVRSLAVFEALVLAMQAREVTSLEYKTIPHFYHRHPAEEDRYALFLLGAELYRRDVLSVVAAQHRLAFRKGRISDYNKARRLGLTVERLATLEEFWPILSSHLRSKHGADPVHTLAEMQALQDTFPAIIEAYGVRVDGALAAGCVVYGTDQLAHVQYIGSTEAGRGTGALDLLFSHLINERFAHLPWFDFGGCNLNDGLFLNRGLAEFKEGFGARAVVHDFYRVDITAAPLDRLRAEAL